MMASPFIRVRRAAHLLLAWTLLGAVPAAALETSEAHRFEIEIVARGLTHPWGLAFLPTGDMLVTERGGQLRVVSAAGVVSAPLAGVPAVAAVGQGGLLDVALHPGFAVNRLVYLALAAGRDGAYGTEVWRGRLADQGLADTGMVFRALPKFPGGRHFGARLLFLPDDTLLVTLGDRGQRPNGQDRGTHPGSILRISASGEVPADNPFAGIDGVRAALWTYGNRNVQGIARDAVSGIVWAHEHGPQGGCELNRVERGANYGWAEITYGRNYVIGTRIGTGETRAGVTPPVLQWTPSIAPSGLAVYRGGAFPHWDGNLFVGSLKFSLLVRLVLDADGRVRHEERLLEDRLGRIRDVRVGPDGYLYLLTDSADGVLARLVPAER
ncbi:MAG: PQQ-dependent sugar dehydrogenase [Gammaproteobacteria bacterium]